MPPSFSAHATDVERIIKRLADQIGKWRSGVQRPDLDKWITATRSSPRKSFLKADRDAFVCAVAYATWMAQGVWYPFALADFAARINPPLSKAEEAIFAWYHGNTDLLGVPIQCFCRDFWDLTQPIVADLLGQRIELREAKERIHRALSLHRLLKDETLDSDAKRHAEEHEKRGFEIYAIDLRIQAERDKERASDKNEA